MSAALGGWKPRRWVSPSWGVLTATSYRHWLRVQEAMRNEQPLPTQRGALILTIGMVLLALVVTIGILL